MWLINNEEKPLVDCFGLLQVKLQETPCQEESPNILFFFPDQHRDDWLGLNPHLPLRTPNIDQLADSGVRFTQAICPSPLGAPSHACLASGKSYEQWAIVDNNQNYPLEQPTYYQKLNDPRLPNEGCLV